MSESTYLSVTALSLYLKRKFDNDPHLAKVHLIGEVSNFRKRAGHQYFSLKDEKSKIRVICFQHVFNKIGFDLKEGMKILVVGRVSLYGASGDYQLYIDHLELAGAGALFQAYKELQDKLTQEGLFTAPKKDIPRFPKRIAIVTSQSGAVIHDIQTTILRRYPIVDLHVYPTVVQGKESADSIVHNLKRIAHADYQYDTVIIARGGGSIEDLWSFNEEKVVRAIYDLPIPVISSIGHETDTTLSDFVADLRAATPTAAAECAVPVLSDVLLYLDALHHRQFTAIQNRIKLLKQRVQRIEQSYIFQQPERLYDGFIQKLDYRTDKLVQAMQEVLRQKAQQFERQLLRFEKNNPGQLIDLGKQQIDYYQEKLNQYMQHYMIVTQQKLAMCIQKLDLLSPLKSMTRGYSYVIKDDKVVSSVSQVKKGESIQIELIDGVVTSRVEQIKKEDKVKKYGSEKDI